MTKPLRTLILLVGVSGCGKSTMARSLVRDEFICEADTYPGLYHNGTLRPNLLSHAHDACKYKVENLMMNQTPLIVQSNTNLDLGEKGIVPYIKLAFYNGYDIQLMLPMYGLLYFSLPQGDTKKNQVDVLCSVRSTGEKIVPINVIHRMVQSFEQHYDRFYKLSQLKSPYDILTFLQK